MKAGIDNNRLRWAAVLCGVFAFALSYALEITQQPANDWGLIGGTALFKAEAAASEPVTYQWQVSTDGGQTFEDFLDGAFFSGSQSAELTITNVQSYLFGTLYRVVVHADGETYTSEAAELRQAIAPVFTQQPVRNYAPEGSIIEATVSGEPLPQLQWQISIDEEQTWEDLVESEVYTGVNSATLQITANDDTMAAYRYRLVATNLAGSVVSNAVVLGTMPVISQHSGPLSCSEGDVVSFSIATEGFPVPAVHWQVSADNGASWSDLSNDAFYSGADTEVLTINAAWDLNGYRYRAVASNVIGERFSNAATLSVLFRPRIVVPPSPTRVFADSPSEILATVSANPAATLQWQFSFEGSVFFNLTDDADHNGTNTPVLRIAPATLDLNGIWYRLRATNSQGTSTSPAAQLTVRELQTFESWLVANAIPEGAYDPDARHGPLQLSNREAYVFGLNPLTARAADLPHLTQATGGEGMAFFYRRNADVDDTIVAFETSADLNTWKEAAPVEDVELWYADGVEGREAVFEWDGDAPQFVRIAVGFQREFSMVLVEGGTLDMSMGTVSVDTFYIDKHEVTWDEWQAVRTYAAANGYDIGSVGAGCADDHPVHSVSWYDVVKWCNAKSEQKGLTPVYTVGGNVYRSGEFGWDGSHVVEQNLSANGYRLPLEAEWEFAARGGNQTNGYTYSGSNDLNEVGWYRDNSSGAACEFWSGRGTWPVGQKAANELGLYDMSGNVWEWCWDRWSDTSSYRHIRGGSWSYSAGYCAVSLRSSVSPGSRGDDYGFRLARSSGN
jgi:formylglycine-generating enzyme required for sulfatase activity